MLNYIWLLLVLAAVLIGGWTGRMQEVTDGAFDGAKTAVTIALGLIGIMALWLGVMRLAERAGLVQKIARGLRPVMRRLFPEVPPDHPAMGSMVMNMAANMLGLGNAATPLGLRAMRDLETLNPRPGVATNAMCMFLAINTSSVQLIPATAIAILVTAGSTRATQIIGTAFLATICSTAVGITAAKLFEKFSRDPATGAPRRDPRHAATVGSAGLDEPIAAEIPPPARAPAWAIALLWLLAGFFLVLWMRLAFPTVFGLPLSPEASAQNALVRVVNGLSVLAIPFLLSFFPAYAAARGIKVYEEFVEGAKEGFTVILKIIPFLVTMLVGINMFKGAGGIDLLTSWLTPVLAPVRFPPDLLPMVLMRPLSGGATLALFTELVQRLGPDNIVTFMAATIFGSTETTFYVVAVYFGSVAVTRTRHAIPAGLLADLAGVIAAVVICRIVFG